MKVFISGGAGFIGSHITTSLVEQDYQVTIFDNLSTGNKSNLPNHKNVNVVYGDISDLSALQTAMQGHDIVFHQAALVSVPQSVKDPILNHTSNVTGTFNMFEAARQAEVKRIIYASSAAVYGNHPQLPKTEASPIQLLVPYATAKYISELFADLYANLYGLESIGLRYMNVYGPKQDPSSPYSGVLSIFCRNALTSQPIRVFGDGEQTRDFIYVGDVVKANLLAMKVNLTDQKSAVFNIGYGQPTSLNNILSQLTKLTNHPLEVTYEANRPGDIKHSYADISAARSQLGFTPTTTLAEGLTYTLGWFRQTLTVS